MGRRIDHDHDDDDDDLLLILLYVQILTYLDTSILDTCVNTGSKYRYDTQHTTHNTQHEGCARRSQQSRLCRQESRRQISYQGIAVLLIPGIILLLILIKWSTYVVWCYDDMIVWWYDDKIIRYDDMMIRWHDDIIEVDKTTKKGQSNQRQGDELYISGDSIEGATSTWYIRKVPRSVSLSIAKGSTPPKKPIGRLKKMLKHKVSTNRGKTPNRCASVREKAAANNSNTNSSSSSAAAWCQGKTASILLPPSHLLTAAVAPRSDRR